MSETKFWFFLLLASVLCVLEQGLEVKIVRSTVSSQQKLKHWFLESSYGRV